MVESAMFSKKDIEGLPSRFLIYGLIDPRNGELRYIGKSSSGRRRIRSHLWPTEFALKTRLVAWIKNLLREGLVYDSVIIQTFITGECLGEAERYWIAHFRAAGSRLVNLTDGGEGFPGLKITDETRKKMSESAKKRKASPETCAKISAGNKGRVKSPEEIARLTQSLRGRKFSPEAKRRMKGGVLAESTKRQIAAALTGRTASDATKQKMRQSAQTRRDCPWSGYHLNRDEKHNERQRVRRQRNRDAKRNPKDFAP
jgi:hypothetical protein